jgi:hypothetical protein
VKPIHSIIFGYAGKARSGKDTAVATILAERGHLYDIKKYAFASELKKEVNRAALACGGMKYLFVQPQEYVQENGNFLPLPEHILYDPDPPMDDPECSLGKQRLFLQWYGGEYRRGCNPMYWINKVAQRIADEKPEIALVSDVRYLNEVSWIQLFGEVVSVSRPGCPSLDGTAGHHASETELDNFKGWDDVILNNGSLSKFRNDVLFSFDSLLTSIPAQRSTVGVN